jgi:hypothetical protein
MKTRIAVIGALAVALIGGGTAYALTSGQTPAPSETVATSPTPTDSATPEPEPTPDAEGTPTADPTPSVDDDDGYLAYVRAEMPPITQLDRYSDGDLIALGHEACKQISEKTPLENLRLVDGEEPTPQGYWLDTSAVFNGALLHYCPELMQKVN